MTSQSQSQSDGKSVSNGLAIINESTRCFQMFTSLNKNKTDIKTIFAYIFKANKVDHLVSAYIGKKKEFGSFWLNLDDDCKMRILSHLMPAPEFDWTMPDIEGWEQMGNSMGMDRWPMAFNQEDVRSHAVGLCNLTYWDIYPANLVWIDKFVLYANNHAIDGYEFDAGTKEEFSKYKGNKFGNWTNWAKFWNKCSNNTKLLICDRLVSYNEKGDK